MINQAEWFIFIRSCSIVIRVLLQSQFWNLKLPLLFFSFLFFFRFLFDHPHSFQVASCWFFETIRQSEDLSLRLAAILAAELQLVRATFP